MKTNKNVRFESIYQEHHAMVMQMCLGFVKGDRDIANDLLQEIFIRIWNHLDNFKGLSTYKTWIYKITVNSCLQYVRTQNKKQTFSITNLDIETPEDSQNEENTSENSVSHLYKAIGQLKELDRLLIMMVLDNQDYDTIGEVIGINATNVRVKIHRIKKRLKNILEKDNYGT